MGKKCSNCDYLSADLANFCGGCGLPFEQYFIAKAGTNLALPYENNSMKEWIDRMIQANYEVMEGTLKDYPIWEGFGKHVAAHIARFRANEFANSIVKISEQGLVRLAQQRVESAMLMEKVKIESQVKRQKLAEDMKLFTDAMAELKQRLIQPPFSDLDEEAKAQIAERLFEEIMRRVFADSVLFTRTYNSLDPIYSGGFSDGPSI